MLGEGAGTIADGDGAAVEAGKASGAAGVGWWGCWEYGGLEIGILLLGLMMMTTGVSR